MKKFEIFNSETGQSQTINCRQTNLQSKLEKLFGQGFWQPAFHNQEKDFVGSFESNNGILYQIYIVN